jgi:LuxR family transcriptional regulator, maltose regulon positive regulatory protein
MGERTIKTQPKAQSYIIKRPRLTKLLDESGARIILLCAPAGYGKTTLAREWVASDRRRIAWYRASSTSSDVVALASGLAAELDAATADLSTAAAERVTALRAVATRPDVLARAVATSRRNWPNDLLIVIDDYHGISASREADEFVGLLVSLLPSKVLITSRERPRWATPRSLVYEGLELGASELAMTPEEVREVFEASHRGQPPPEVTLMAGGWPAIVGLAARTARTHFPTTVLPRRLYDFLADDLIRTASVGAREALTLIAVSGTSDRRLVSDLLGDIAEDALLEADTRGLIALETDDVLGLHPLLREFLVERVKREVTPNSKLRWSELVDQLADLGRWDECLSVIEAIPQDTAIVTQLIERSLEELLLSGRVQSVERWVDLGRRAGVDDAALDLADGEVALRRGDYDRALSLGGRAADKLGSGDGATRARLVAARAAHLSDRTATAAEFFKAAEASAETVQTRASALWGQFLAEGEQQSGYAATTLEKFREADDGSIDHELRCVHGQVLIALFRGVIDNAVELLERARPLWSRASDPLVRLASLNQYAWALGSLARYGEALTIAEELIDEAAGWGLDFAANHGSVARARALIGLRRFADAQDGLAQLKRRLIDEPDPWTAANMAIQNARLALSVGDLDRAADTLSENLDDRHNPTTRAEYHAYRALVAAVRGDVLAAKRSIGVSEGLPFHLDSRAVIWFTEAIIGLTGARPGRAALRSFRLASANGHADSVVIACRARPELAIHIAADIECCDPLRDIFVRSSDEAVARIAGIQIPRTRRRTVALSPRELEVYELLAQGRTNPEIAQALYISDSTAKVHVKHILEKLGVRSRVEAARAWRTDEPAR